MHRRADAAVRIVGAPLDETATYRAGAADGPDAIRAASESIESYAHRFRRDLEEIALSDEGNVDCSTGTIDDALSRIETAILSLRPSFPVVLGGEHTVTLAVLHALSKECERLGVVVFDSHFDLRESYDGRDVSHATWLRRALEIDGIGPVVVCGVRSGTRDEYADASVRWVGPDLLLDHRTLSELAGGSVYVTIDIDVLDASLVPGCGNPEPGGPLYPVLEAAIDRLSALDILGFDVVETAPVIDPSGVTTIVGARIVRDAILAWAPRS